MLLAVRGSLTPFGKAPRRKPFVHSLMALVLAGTLVWSHTTGPAGAATSLDPDWVLTLTGTDTSNNLYVEDSAVDKDGNLFVVGQTMGSYDIDPGASVTNVSLDRRAVIVKYDSSGAYQWHFGLGGANSRWGGISFQPNGEQFWLTGSICGANGSQTFNFNRTATPAVSFTYSVGACQTMLLKYDTSGNVVVDSGTSTAIAMRLQSGATSTYARRLVANADGVYITGQYYSSSSVSVDFNPLGFPYQLTGARASGGKDAFLAKYSSSGQLLWVKSFGSASGTGEEFGFNVGVDAAGNVYNHGVFSTNANYDLGGGAINFTGQRHYLVKFDSSGVHQWSFKFSGGDPGNYDRMNDFAVDPSGNVYVAGRQAGTHDHRGTLGTARNVTTPTSAYGAVIVSFDSNGGYRWHAGLSLKSHPSGTTQNLSVVETISVASDGSVFAAGLYRGTMDFDPSASEYLLSPSTSSCTEDRFVVMYSSTGSLLWADRPESACATGTPNQVNLGGMRTMSSLSLGTSFVVAFRAYSPVTTFMVKYGVDTATPAVPQTPDLTAASDTGVSSTDNITSDNTPTVNVVAGEFGGVVTITAQRSGQSDVVCQSVGAPGSGSDCTFSTSLADGSWTLTATHADGAGNTSGASVSSTITVDTVAPALQSISPARDATGVNPSGNLTFTYDEGVEKGTSGTILVKTAASIAGCTSSSTTAQSIVISNAAVSTSGSVITVNPPTDLAVTTAHCVSFPSGTVRDAAGNNAAAHDPSGSGGMRFSTGALQDLTSPTMLYGELFANGRTVRLTFDESLHTVTAAASRFTVTASARNITPTSVTVSGVSIDLALPVTLEGSASVTVAYSPPSVDSANTNPAVQDAAGNDVSSFSRGITNNSVADGTAPGVSISAPSSPSSSMTLSYTLTFTEPVSGIEAADFRVVGNTSCTSITPSAASTTSTITVTVVCTVDGLVILLLTGDSVVDGNSNTGPTSDASASGVTITSPSTTTIPVNQQVATTTTIASVAPTVTTSTTTSTTTTIAVSAAGGSTATAPTMTIDGDVATSVSEDFVIPGVSGSARSSDGSIFSVSRTGAIGLKIRTGYIGLVSGTVKATYRVSGRATTWSCTVRSTRIGTINKNAKRSVGNWFPKKLHTVANKCVVPAALRTALKSQKVVLTSRVRFVKQWPTTGKPINALTNAKIPVGTRVFRVTIGN
jgi:hypothetical protein